MALTCLNGLCWCRFVVCDSYENPHKVYMWDLQANTAFVVGTFVEANWPSPETGRRGVHPHFTPDGVLHCTACSCAGLPVLFLAHALVFDNCQSSGGSS